MLDDIGHKDGQQFRHTIGAGGVGAIVRARSDDLACPPSGIDPLPRHRVYHVEYA